MSVDIYDLNCPFCEKVYKLPREKVIKHVGKTIYCRGCGNPFSVPPLPVFESNAGLVVESPKPVERATTAELDAATESIETRIIPARNEADRFAHTMREPVVAESNGHPLANETPIAELPPPFSAEVLPPIEELLPIVSEPPTVDLAAASAEPGSADAELPPYRHSTEHGAVAVEEDASYFHDGSSSEGASAGDDLMAARNGISAEAASDLAIDSAAGFDALSPVVEPKRVPPSLSRATPQSHLPSDLPKPLLAGLNLDDVPIARAVAANGSLPAMRPQVAPFDIRPLRSRLTFLTVLSMLIALLLVAILLTMLGYIPHRPV